jgi:hypothetical protein
MSQVMIGSVKTTKDSLKGKKVLYYYESGDTDLFTIKSSRMADPKFAIRDLFISLGDSEETIPQDKIEDFKAGKLVSLKSGKRYFGLKLKKR